MPIGVSEFFRSPASAARDYQRQAHDRALAERRNRLGLDAYRTAGPVTRVDLASGGSLEEPGGRELLGWRLYQTRAAAIAAQMTDDLRAFVAVTDTVSFSNKEVLPIAGNVCAVTVRPRMDMTDSDGVQLLNSAGLAPVTELRNVFTQFSIAVGSALEYVPTQKLMVPIAVGRHVRPCFGGTHFDCHTHVTGIVNPKHLDKLKRYLTKVFGAGRVWISAIEQPDPNRKLLATAAYPWWRFANQDLGSLIDDNNLLEFCTQTTSLRFVEALGSFRVFRQGPTDGSTAGSAGGIDHDPQDYSAGEDTPTQTPKTACDDRKYVSEQEHGSQKVAVATGVDTDEQSAAQPESNTTASAGATAERVSESVTAAPSDPSLVNGPSTPCTLRGVARVWIGLSRRIVARVENYTSFGDLLERYDLRADISRAKRFAADAATHLYLHSATPEEYPWETETRASKSASNTAAGADPTTAESNSRAGQPGSKSASNTAAGGDPTTAESNSRAGQPDSKSVSKKAAAGPATEAAAGTRSRGPHPKTAQRASPPVEAVAEHAAAGPATAAAAGTRNRGPRPQNTPPESGPVEAVAEHAAADPTIKTVAGTRGRRTKSRKDPLESVPDAKCTVSVTTNRPHTKIEITIQL